MARVLVEIRRAIPASLEAIEDLSLGLRHALRGSCSRADMFASELLCREALANAVMHGSAQDRTRMVAFTARLRPDSVTMDITDEGPGFDWRRKAAHSPGDCDTRGRGLAIYERYASRIRFNHRGNRLIIMRRLGDGARKNNGLENKEK